MRVDSLFTANSISQVAVDHAGTVVGYVLSKMDEDATELHGHVTSLSVKRHYRKLGAMRLSSNA